MVVSSLTSSKYWDIGENHLTEHIYDQTANFHWSTTNSLMYLQYMYKQNEFVDVLTTSNRHIQAVMNNL